MHGPSPVFSHVLASYMELLTAGLVHTYPTFLWFKLGITHVDYDIGSLYDCCAVILNFPLFLHVMSDQTSRVYIMDHGSNSFNLFKQLTRSLTLEIQILIFILNCSFHILLVSVFFFVFLFLFSLDNELSFSLRTCTDENHS